MTITTKKRRRPRLLSDAEIKEIHRSLAEEPNVTILDLCVKYRVGQTTIYRIIPPHLKHRIRKNPLDDVEFIRFDLNDKLNP